MIHYFLSSSKTSIVGMVKCSVGILILLVGGLTEIKELLDRAKILEAQKKIGNHHKKGRKKKLASWSAIAVKVENGSMFVTMRRCGSYYKKKSTPCLRIQGTKVVTKPVMPSLSWSVYFCLSRFFLSPRPNRKLSPRGLVYFFSLFLLPLQFFLLTQLFGTNISCCFSRRVACPYAVWHSIIEQTLLEINVKGPVDCFIAKIWTTQYF